MKLSQKLDLTKVVEKAGGSQPYLESGYLDAEGSRLLATNGHIAVSIPVQVLPDDVSGALSVASITALSKLGGDMAVSRSAVVLKDGRTFPRPASASVDVISMVDKIIPRRTECSIGLDAALLAAIQKALGCDTLRLYFAVSDAGALDPHKAVLVEPLSGGVPDSVGVIMPCRLTG